MSGYIPRNPFPNGLSTKSLLALNLNIRCTHEIIHRSVDSVSHNIRFIFHIKIIEQHGNRQNLCKRIGNILAGSLRPRAVNGFKHRSALAGTRRG